MKPFRLLPAVVLSLLCALASAQSAPAAITNPLAVSRVFRYEEMPVRTFASGVEGRQVFSGTLATGESVAAHESTQPAGTVPSPLHPIQHSEFIVLLEGTVAFEHDGISELAGPGSVVYVAPGTVHHIKNTGSTPARYVVLQVGGDTKK